MVYTKPYKAPLLFPCIKEWWQYVTVTPEDNKITVFNKGNSKGLIDSIPKGGHLAPNSTVGDNALWKKDQKIAKKNNASEIINKATPIFIPLCTARVWFPRYVASFVTSLNHKLIEYITDINAIYNTNKALVKLWNVNTALKVRANKDVLVYNGQGLGDTRWKGWAWKLLLIILVIKIKKKKKKIYLNIIEEIDLNC